MQKLHFDWGDLIKSLYRRSGKTKLHIDELVELAVDFGQIPGAETPESFKKAANGFLARNTKSKTPQYARVKNSKKGTYYKGVYRIKSQSQLDLVTKEIPKVSTQFTGAAGEFAVLSELLFRGFNASKMTVDDGIDVVASKDGSYFHIQVKTATCAAGRPYQASIRAKAFQHASNTFYIVVLRTYTSVRYVNDYVIFPSSEIRRLIAQKVLKDSDTLSLRISTDAGRYLLNGSYDVTHHVNDFDSIV